MTRARLRRASDERVYAEGSAASQRARHHHERRLKSCTHRGATGQGGARDKKQTGRPSRFRARCWPGTRRTGSGGGGDGSVGRRGPPGLGNRGSKLGLPGRSTETSGRVALSRDPIRPETLPQKGLPSFFPPRGARALLGPSESQTPSARSLSHSRVSAVPLNRALLSHSRFAKLGTFPDPRGCFSPSSLARKCEGEGRREECAEEQRRRRDFNSAPPPVR